MYSLFEVELTLIVILSEFFSEEYFYLYSNNLANFQNIFNLVSSVIRLLEYS